MRITDDEYPHIARAVSSHIIYLGFTEKTASADVIGNFVVSSTSTENEMIIRIRRKRLDQPEQLSTTIVKSAGEANDLNREASSIIKSSIERIYADARRREDDEAKAPRRG
jgi:hypothetical protein